MFGFIYNHSDISASLNEIYNNLNLFKGHAPYGYVPRLRECKTFYYSGSILNQHLTRTRDASIIPSSIESLPNTWDLIQKSNEIISSPNPKKQLGRSYITILDPGKKAYEHVDTDGSKYFDLTNRYQIYLSTNDDVAMDKMNKGFNAKSGDLVRFDPHNSHYFHNNGNTPLIIVVFDLFHETVRLSPEVIGALTQYCPEFISITNG